MCIRDRTQYDSFPALMSDPSEASKIMHGQLETEDGMTIMAADYPASMAAAAQTSLSGHSVSVSGCLLYTSRCV